MKMKNSDICVLSIDAGGTSLKSALVKHDTVIEESWISLPVCSDGSALEIQEAYIQLGQAARQTARRLNMEIRQTAVCIPGPFDYPSGRFLMKHKYQTVYGYSIIPWLEKGLGKAIPIRFLHDSTAFLLGACSDILLPGDGRLCGVIIGTGLGFASMIDGKIFEQPSGGPGISIYGLPYLNGTAEDYISKRGIMTRYRQLISDCRKEIEVKESATLAFQADEKARQVFEETGEHLASVLLPVISKYHFTNMVLRGAISKSADLFLPALKRGLETVSISVQPASNPDTAPLLGAARYLFY